MQPYYVIDFTNVALFFSANLPSADLGNLGLMSCGLMGSDIRWVAQLD